jgi:hypothetical protein
MSWLNNIKGGLMNSKIEPYIFPFLTFIGLVGLAEHVPFAGWVLGVGLCGVIFKYL